MRKSCCLLALLCSAAAAAAARPAPPKPSGVSVAGWDDAAAWKPMFGSKPAELLKLEGRPAVRMPCNFKGTTIERASWDLKVKLDLTACRGLRFDVLCRNLNPISSFSLYLHSGDGWYSARFSPTSRDGWSSVRIEKTDTRTEGRPCGWAAVDTIRVSAWRGRDEDTEFAIANLALDGADAPVVIIRGESVAAKSPEEAKSVNSFAQGMAAMLDGLGLPYAVMSDLDLTAARLEGKKVAILPHNPQMPEAVADQLVRYLDGGGKVLAFYTVHGKLAERMGIAGGAHVRQTYAGHFASIRKTGTGLPGLPEATGQRSWNVRDTQPIEGRSRVVATWFNDKGESTGKPAVVCTPAAGAADAVFMTHVLLGDDPSNKPMLLLALLGHLEPKLWKQVADARLDAAKLDAAFAKVRAPAQAAKSQAAFDELAAASALRKDALRLVAEAKYSEAIAKAGAVQDALLRAFCSAQQPLAGEHRAWWCHSAFGVAGMTWDEAIKTLADNGFTAILPNMLWGGTAYYPSTVLPVAPEVAERGDQIALCLAACRKYGVECHVWKVNWNMSHRAPKAFAERMGREGRIQVGFDGTPNPRWLCPSHPDNQKLEIDSMVEVAEKYDVHGVHFDYIRYPGPSHCFCPGCRERFETLIGRKVAAWPADVRSDKALEQQWLDFRRASITAVVAAVAERARKARPGVKISAAVFRNWLVDRDQVGQDWKVWCEKGWMDFVCPMDYTPYNTQFANMVQQQRACTGKVPCYPGIGLSTWPTRDVVKLIEQIQITRRLGTQGFTIFNYGVPEALDVAPLCGRGITRKK